MMPRLIAAIVMMLLLPFAAARAEFPDRTVTLLVSFPPGGLTDIPARILAPEMQKRLGQPVIVENTAAASGATARLALELAYSDGTRPPATLLVQFNFEPDHHLRNRPRSALKVG